MEDKHARLKAYISENSDELRRIIGHYAISMNIATSLTAESIAEEVLNEVVVEALRHMDRLRTPENPMPWLLGISLNLLKRQRRDAYTLDQREPLIHDLIPVDDLNESEILDRFFGVHAPDDRPDDEGEIIRILAQLPAEDQHLLRLALLHDLNGEALAREIGITPGAVRVRLYRARKRLRQIWGSRERIENAD